MKSLFTWILILSCIAFVKSSLVPLIMQTNSIAMSDLGDFVVAVSQIGVFYSNDSGYHWLQSDSEPFESINAVSCSGDGQTVFVGGGTVSQGQPIYKSNDSCATWTALNGFFEDWIDISCDSNCTNIYALGYAQGIVTFSNNGGEFWARETVSLSDTLLSIASSANGSTVVAGSSSSYYYVSHNHGKTWSSVATSTWSSFNTISLTSLNSTIFLGSQNDKVLLLARGSSLTETAAGPISMSVLDTAISATGQYLVAAGNLDGFGKSVLISNSYGEHWMQTLVANSSTACAMSQSGSVIVIGANELIYVTMNLGVSWEVGDLVIPSPTPRPTTFMKRSDDDDDSVDRSASAGEIAGIVIGLIVFISCVVGLACSKKNEDENNTEQKKDLRKPLAAHPNHDKL